jgi:hypothetical protein
MLQTKALYNLLRLNEDPSVQADPWALEDLRAVPLEDLYQRLKPYYVELDKRSFFHFAEETDTPEELTDVLLPDGAPEKLRDPFYLLIFELWRRLLPEKQSLSIFCDELDHRIALYDEGNLENDEPIQDALANLLEILEENTDMGVDPQEVLIGISDYCAHDLEGFLYDYISDLLDSGNSIYATELLEGFSPYVADPLWFDVLRARLADIGEANLQIHQLLKHDLELPLLTEILRFLSANGEPTLFKLAVKKALPLLTEQEDLLDVMRWIADFYRRLDEEEKEKAVQTILNGRKPGPIVTEDLETLEELIKE